jgi:predicted dehydrogenase
MPEKIRVGVFGGGRGQTMVRVLAAHPDAEVTAICDQYRPTLEKCRRVAAEAGAAVTCYEDFDSFLNHDMDAVVLANYCTDHAPYAVRLLDSGRHVVSEVVACQTMGEAVALVEAVERSGRVYAYAENYSYFRGTLEMQRLYREGALGEFLHGEGEYIHDCESAWTPLTCGQRDHWRNWTPSTFYITHSLGPIVTITGTRPVRLTAYESPNTNKRRYGARSGEAAVVVLQMSNGATAKVLPWAPFKRHPGGVWYSIYGTKGMAETDRWADSVNKLYVYLEEKGEMEAYEPAFPFETELSQKVAGHGGSDFYTMHFFLDAILDRPGKEHSIDVYQALDMSLPAILGYRSIWEGNQALSVPDFRSPAEREAYRNDNWTPDPRAAGPGQPDCSSRGPVPVDDSVYEAQAREFESMMPEQT